MAFNEEMARTWAEKIVKKLEEKMPAAVQKAQGLSFLPYTVKDGQWAPGPFDGLCWWTNGFWPAEMLMMYAVTGQSLYLEEASRAENMLDGAFQDLEHLHHDVGFMWRISSGFHHELTGDEKSKKRALFAAQLLAGRYNPNGFIRAWNGECVGWAIIDCMMNLSLLYWASEQTGDPRYRLIAMSHADTVLTHFFRPDGSNEHIVCFDPETGAVLEKPAGQGVAVGSQWSRGQAWALYGFAISYCHTGAERYLRASLRSADHFIEQVQADWLPNCDFCQPSEPILKDDCAAGIAACGMLSLADVLGTKGEKYREGAFRLLKAAEEAHADWSLDNPAILTHCTGAYHSNDHHIAMNYGDFYFIEGVARLLGEKRLQW
ncbi:MAG: glycoside hydrolase family 88 protein [Eubacteriales bacterium]|nr:glycoside hydrolase family 88 protein [Eubacteriales bacterium]